MREQVASWARALRRGISPGARAAVAGTPPQSPAEDPATGLPPEALRFRVGGSSDPERFRDVGRRSARAIEGGLGLLDRRVGECERILDFGCGCCDQRLRFGTRLGLHLGNLVDRTLQHHGHSLLHRSGSI